MVTFGSAYLAAVGLGVVVSAGLTGLALRNVERAESKVLAVLTAGITVWAGGNLLSMLAVSREWTIRWVQIQWFGVATVPTVLFVFVLVYAGHGRYLTRRRLAALAVVPAAVVGLAVTSPGHELLWTAIEPSTATPGGFAFENGVAFYAYAAYSYALLAIATVALSRFIVRSTDLYRGQAALLMIAALAPWAGNVSYVISDSVLDATPIGFTIAAAALGVAVLRYRLTDIVPIARNTIVEHINDGVIVLDRKGRIVDVNPQAEPYLRETGADSAIGRHATTVFPDPIVNWLGTKHFEEHEEGSGFGPDVDTNRSSTVASHSDVDGTDEHAPAGGKGPSSDDHTAATTVRLGRGADQQHLAVETTALADADRRIGQLVIVRDVTDQRRYERELERQNDRLDRFASVVSHDLRNPLNVADGYLSVLEERYDDPAIGEVGTSLERMEHIIEDVLALARHGDAISDRDTVELAALANTAWNSVDTADAALQIETSDHTVSADESRLAQALENLFRNSVEHGSTSPDSQARQDSVEHGSTSSQDGSRPDDSVEHGSTCSRPKADDSVEHGGSNVTVTVGTIDDGRADGEETGGGDTPDTAAGFFVADDGRGIPEDDREAVLESGYTTDPGGTGLGLDIVTQIVEAHGWSFAVSESADGGARFDVRYDGGSGATDDRCATVERNGRPGGNPAVNAGETDDPDASDDSGERCQCGP